MNKIKTNPEVQTALDNAVFGGRITDKERSEWNARLNEFDSDGRLEEGEREIECLPRIHRNPAFQKELAETWKAIKAKLEPFQQRMKERQALAKQEKEERAALGVLRESGPESAAYGEASTRCKAIRPEMDRALSRMQSALEAVSDDLRDLFQNSIRIGLEIEENRHLDVLTKTMRPFANSDHKARNMAKNSDPFHEFLRCTRHFAKIGGRIEENASLSYINDPESFPFNKIDRIVKELTKPAPDLARHWKINLPQGV